MTNTTARDRNEPVITTDRVSGIRVVGITRRRRLRTRLSVALGVRSGNGPPVMASLRNLAITVSRLTATYRPVQLAKPAGRGR